MQSPFMFLLETIFDLYIMVILLRFFLQLFRADFYNPFSQFIVKATNPVLKPLRQIIPSMGGMDVSSLVFAYLVSLLKFVFIFSLLANSVPAFTKLIFISFSDLLYQGVNLLFWMVLIRALMSWISPDQSNPVIAVFNQLTEPLMAPVRKIIPPMGGLDLSPLFLLLGLQFLLTAIKAWFLIPLFQTF